MTKIEMLENEVKRLGISMHDAQLARVKAEQAQSHLVGEVSEWKLRADRLLNIVQSLSHLAEPKLRQS